MFNILKLSVKINIKFEKTRFSHTLLYIKYAFLTEKRLSEGNSRLNNREIYRNFRYNPRPFAPSITSYK